MANSNVKVGGSVLLPREEIERALRERALKLAQETGELPADMNPVDFHAMANVELPDDLQEALVAWTR